MSRRERTLLEENVLLLQVNFISTFRVKAACGKKGEKKKFKSVELKGAGKETKTEKKEKKNWKTGGGTKEKEKKEL